MEIYNYDSITGEFLNSSTAQPDPLEDGKWLIPANATDVKPPYPSSNETVIFSGNGWEIVPDYRGEVFWNPDRTQYTIKEIGVEPNPDSTREEPPVPLGNIRVKKKREIKLARKEEERTGVIINGVRYAGNESNRLTIKEALDFVQKAGITAFNTWKDSDGGFHTNHPVSDVDTALMQIANRRQALITRESELIQEIDQAFSNNDRDLLESITWSFVEPVARINHLVIR